MAESAWHDPQESAGLDGGPGSAPQGPRAGMRERLAELEEVWTHCRRQLRRIETIAGMPANRLLTTLVHEMRLRRNVRYGLTTLCVGVGHGEATVLESIG